MAHLIAHAVVAEVAVKKSFICFYAVHAKLWRRHNVFAKIIVQDSVQNTVGMTAAGWIFLTVAWTTILSVAVFCYRKVLQKAFERRQRDLLESSPLGQEVKHKKVYK